MGNAKMHDEERDLLLQAAMLQKQLDSLTIDRDRLRRELAKLQAEVKLHRVSEQSRWRFRTRVPTILATSVIASLFEWAKTISPFLPWAVEF